MKFNFFNRKPLPADTPVQKNLSSQSIKPENPRNIPSLYAQELSQLTATNLKFYFETARKGLNFFKSLVFDEIRRRDLRIAGVCQTRKLAAAMKEWEVSFSKESTVPETKQKEVVDFIMDNLHGENLNIVNVFTDMIEAQIQGVSTFEKIFKVKDGKVYLDKLLYIPNHLLLYDDREDKYFYIDPAKLDAFLLRAKAANLAADRIDVKDLALPDLLPEKFLEVHSLDGNSQNGFLNGCIDALIWCYFFKSYGIKDWSIYVERFASPAVIGYYDQLMSTTERTNLLNNIKNFGNLFRGIFPKESKLEFLKDEGRSQTHDLFNGWVSMWNDETSIRVLGQASTTNTKHGGSFAEAKVGDIIRKDILAGDMMLIKYGMNQVITQLLELNAITLEDNPEFRWKEEEDIEYKKNLSEYMRNLKDCGWRVVKEDVEEIFDVEVEEINIATGTAGGWEHLNPKQPDNKDTGDAAGQQKKTEEKQFAEHKLTSKFIDDYIKELYNNNKPKK